MSKIRPLQKQLDFLNWELGVFFHFGIRTFYEGHKDWDLKSMPLNGFNPVNLDCEAWIETIKKAGAKYAILVCKHHDGFCNWPSHFSEYTVANTPWKNGKGDVVKEYVEACRKHDIKVGIYYSPAEFGSKEKSAEEYDTYFINQISELLTNYSKIDYLWFDGCGSEGHIYNEEKIIDKIRFLQPDILIFNMWDPDTRWVGNEAGIANCPNFNITNSLEFSILSDRKDNLSQEKFLPVECDCRIRYENWFYSEDDEDSLKSLDEIMGLYYYSVGRGGNLLINIAPNREGKLEKADSQRFLEFGREISRRFSCPVEQEASFNSNACTLNLKEKTIINHVVLQENLVYGENIKHFKIVVYPLPYGDGICVYEGKNIGHKAICRFPSIKTQKVEIVFDETVEEFSNSNIENINLFYVK